MHVEALVVKLNDLVRHLPKIKDPTDGNPIFWGNGTWSGNELVRGHFLAELCMLDHGEPRYRCSRKAKMKPKLFTANRS